MNHVRALMIKSSRRIARPIVTVSDRIRVLRTPPVVELESVRRRISLVLAAMFGRRFELVSLRTPPPSNMLGTRRRQPPAVSHGDTIELPATVRVIDDVDSTAATYRLLAVEQAARLVRGSHAFAPDHDDPVARDLYHLCEAVAIDATIVCDSRGFTDGIVAARRRAIASRRSRRGVQPREAAVDRLVSSALDAHPTDTPNGIVAASNPEESLAWAREMSAALLRLGGDYRPRVMAELWGATLENDGSAKKRGVPQGSMIPPSPGVGSGQATVPFGGSDDDDQEISPQGTTAARSHGSPDDAEPASEQEPAQPPDDSRVFPAGESSSGGNVMAQGYDDDSLSDLDRNILKAARAPDAVLYPEWDCNSESYRRLGAVVHEIEPRLGDPAWVEHVIDENPALVRRIRREFELFRARRVRMLRQRDGEELDLDACVRAITDATTGDAPSDRLYMAVRPARRPIAITMLVDVSGSTRDPVTDERRVIDIEKVTLLLAGVAFDALGDAYAILTFASSGAADVRIATLKSFAESNGDVVRRRIAGIHPVGNTRLGAAIRHATRRLAAENAGHRLLLILSDGKPSDVDRYFTGYAVEDSRQAVFEARAAGVYPFCLTIDASEPDPYLAHVFGAAGHTVLRHPEQLPLALLDLVRALLRGGRG
jgi:nitric oxide reductase NorD protein